MGFLPDIRRILALLPTQRQSLLFSATFSEEIKKLANQMLRSPTLIEVARRNAPADLVKHQVFETPASRKHAVLANLIRSRDMKQVLVFLRMKRDCNKLARDLVRDGINATAIHSDRTQAEREQALTDFKEGRSTVLVATDIAARGIDIEELPFVINFELPYTPEDYVHRIGRTGRAGMPGEAISLVCPDEMRLLADIEKLLKRAIPRQSVEEGAADLAAEREYERGKERERRPRREERNDEPRRAAPASPSPKPRPQVAADGFDFSKPYEPTSGPATASAAPPPPQRQRTGRPTAALLGGFVARDKK
jgi:ATP-dependent RNA helicase RhlE